MSIESQKQSYNNLEARIVVAANSSTDEVIKLADEAFYRCPDDSLARWQSEVCHDYDEKMRLGALATILAKYIDETTPVETENAVRAAVAEALGLYVLESYFKRIYSYDDSTGRYNKTPEGEHND